MNTILLNHNERGREIARELQIVMVLWSRQSDGVAERRRNDEEREVGRG